MKKRLLLTSTQLLNLENILERECHQAKRKLEKFKPDRNPELTEHDVLRLRVDKEWRIQKAEELLELVRNIA